MSRKEPKTLTVKTQDALGKKHEYKINSTWFVIKILHGSGMDTSPDLCVITAANGRVLFGTPLVNVQTILTDAVEVVDGNKAAINTRLLSRKSKDSPEGGPSKT